MASNRHSYEYPDPSDEGLYAGVAEQYEHDPPNNRASVQVRPKTNLPGISIYEGPVGLYSRVRQNDGQVGSVYEGPAKMRAGGQQGGRAAAEDRGRGENAAGGSNVRKRIKNLIFALSLFTLIALMAWNKADLLELRARVTSVYISTNTYPSSCLELKGQGYTNDGFYFIQPSKDFSPEEVFCDMATDGGGWTLVASVHESDIKRKCDFHDLWAHYLDPDRPEYADDNSWGNMVTFGSAPLCTSADYKNAAYVKMQASDVMVWHVQSGVPTTATKTAADLRYRTNNGFLQRYGGNLHSLYSQHSALNQIKATTGNAAEQKMREVLEVLVQHSGEIRSQIKGWKPYGYGPSDHRIEANKNKHDSLYCCYPYYGNTVHAVSPACNIRLTYGAYHECSMSSSQPTVAVQYASAKSNPFFAVGIIHNEGMRHSEFAYHISSHRSVPLNITMFKGVIRQGNFKLQYLAREFSSSSIATSCELNFVVSNTKEWRSVEPSSFDFYDDTAQFRAIGNPSKILIGYALLAKTMSLTFNADEIRNVSKMILQPLTKIHTLTPDFQLNNRSVFAPVIFDKGNADEILKRTPPNYKRHIEPGFIQFRAYNIYGYPNALCAGFKPHTVAPEYVCIGGKSKEIGEKGTCGDLAGWEGTRDDTVQTNQLSGSAHAQADFFTSIMIFCR